MVLTLHLRHGFGGQAGGQVGPSPAAVPAEGVVASGEGGGTSGQTNMGIEGGTGRWFWRCGMGECGWRRWCGR
jgi:hypothetical protein